MEIKKENFQKQKSDTSKLHEILELEGVPFAAVRQDDKWFVVLGKYKLSDTLKSYEECEAFVKDTSWTMLVNVMSIIAQDTVRTLQAEDELKEIKKFEKKINEN